MPRPHSLIRRAYLKAKRIALDFTPKPIKQLLYRGSARYCPVCNSHVRFFRQVGKYPDVMCPVCKSRCRTRLVWCFLDKDKTIFDESQTKRLLHIAPEPCFEKRFKEMPEIDYLSGDINASKAMEQIDIMNISYPDNYFDVLFCSHVLEHVIDDRKAVREFYRVLKPNGVAMIMVPINRPQSVEDPAITDPNEQKRLYGTRGHVRAYGPDFVNRLSEAGFEVTKVRPQDVLDDKEAIRQGVRGGPLFLCRK